MINIYIILPTNSKEIAYLKAKFYTTIKLIIYTKASAFTLRIKWPMISPSNDQRFLPQNLIIHSNNQIAYTLIEKFSIFFNTFKEIIKEPPSEFNLYPPALE
jgi:hypothetical protein